MRRLALYVVPALAVIVGLAAGSAVAQTTRLAAIMTAEEAVPRQGPPGARGTASFDFDQSTGQLCYELTWEGITAPTEAHIHEGEAGVPGGRVVIDLNIAANGSAGCLPVDPAEVQAIIDDPDRHYVDLHTNGHPDGAMRGQLSRTSPPPP